MSEAENQDVIYEIQDEIGTITLNRPQARNALTFEMYGQIADILEGAPTDGSAKAIIITGAGDKAFAAGTDISLFRDFTAEKGIHYERSGDANFARMEKCPLPVIAAISGACTGGGAGIASICDMRIASRDIKFGFPIARTLGNCLSAETLGRLVRLIGEAKVMDVILTSRLIEAEEALASGLVNEIVEEDVDTAALSCARQIAAKPPEAMALSRKLLRGDTQAVSERVEEEIRIFAERLTAPETIAAFQAFMSKKKA